MSSVCFYFQIHQPYRFRRYTIFDMGDNSLYEDDDRNCDNMLRIARNSYLPMNDIIYSHIKKFDGKFKVAFSISGIALDQFEQYAPEIIDSFRGLSDTSCVEFLAETYGHSLSFLKSKEEFVRQVKKHSERIYELFGQKPKVFRNTELIYNNELADIVAQMGYKAVITNSVDHILAWRSPNYLYQSVSSPDLKVLLKNNTISDDISMRFSDRNWEHWPLTADKYANWCHNTHNNGDMVNIFLDYDTFGEKHKKDSGIFEFMKYLPQEILAHKEFKFNTPSELIKLHAPVGNIDAKDYISCEHDDHGITAWCGNDMQLDALQAVYDLENTILSLNNADIIDTWMRLQTSDHFYCMSSKWFANSCINGCVNQYQSPYDAYINYMNILADFKLLIDNIILTKNSDESSLGTISTDKKKTTVKKVVEKKTADKKETTVKKTASAKKISAKSTTKNAKTEGTTVAKNISKVSSKRSVAGG